MTAHAAAWTQPGWTISTAEDVWLMKIQELKLLLAVADDLHFGRAAERIGMAQPQLSASIRRIEEEAGV